MLARTLGGIDYFFWAHLIVHIMSFGLQLHMGVALFLVRAHLIAHKVSLGLQPHLDVGLGVVAVCLGIGVGRGFGVDFRTGLLAGRAAGWFVAGVRDEAAADLAKALLRLLNILVSWHRLRVWPAASRHALTALGSDPEDRPSSHDR
jgi:hypothetical protein